MRLRRYRLWDGKYRKSPTCFCQLSYFISLRTYVHFFFNYKAICETAPLTCKKSNSYLSVVLRKFSLNPPITILYGAKYLSNKLDLNNLAVITSCNYPNNHTTETLELPLCVADIILLSLMDTYDYRDKHWYWCIWKKLNLNSWSHCLCHLGITNTKFIVVHN